MRTLFTGLGLASALAAGGLALSGCATEDYVDQHIATVNSHVDAVNGRVDQLTGQVGALSTKVNTVEQTANSAVQKADAAAAGKFTYTAQGEPVAVYFDTGQWTLTDAAKMSLTDLIGRLNGENKGVYLEIVGHGDPRGSVNANRELGLRRAAEVRRFLSDNGVGLNRMDPVSWGEEKVTTAGRSAEELQQSRRVDIIVKG